MYSTHEQKHIHTDGKKPLGIRKFPSFTWCSKFPFLGNMNCLAIMLEGWSLESKESKQGCFHPFFLTLFNLTGRPAVLFPRKGTIWKDVHREPLIYEVKNHLVDHLLLWPLPELAKRVIKVIKLCFVVPMLSICKALEMEKIQKMPWSLSFLTWGKGCVLKAHGDWWGLGLFS